METVPIAAPFEGYLQALGPLFDGRAPDVAEENLQSRTRGGILMALSNKFGGLLLTTGNKSEYAVGYATIYGDMIRIRELDTLSPGRMVLKSSFSCSSCEDIRMICRGRS